MTAPLVFPEWRTRSLDDALYECRELIESNLQLFMGLSAGGRNIHSKIDERVNR